MSVCRAVLPPCTQPVSGVNAAQLLRDRDLVAVDAADALPAALCGLRPQLVGLLLCLAQRVGALPERDHDRVPALAVREPDGADVPR